ncbi:MAG: YdeI/OmpD-associated family protein [Gemmatimonadota bacterium]
MSETPFREVEVEIHRDGGMCFIPVPFDPKTVFGKVRAPVRVTLAGTPTGARSRPWGGTVCIPLRKSHREAAGVEGGERHRVRIELDTEERTVDPPPELQRALRDAPPAWERWEELAYTHKREYVQWIEEARKPETRARRIEDAVRQVGARPARGRADGSRPPGGGAA